MDAFIPGCRYKFKMSVLPLLLGKLRVGIDGRCMSREGGASVNYSIDFVFRQLCYHFRSTKWQ